MIVILKKKNCSFRILCGWHNMQYILIIKFLKLKINDLLQEFKLSIIYTIIILQKNTVINSYFMWI